MDAIDSAGNIPYQYDPCEYISPVEINFTPEPVYIDWGNCTPLPPVYYLPRKQVDLTEIKNLLQQILDKLN
jgi:hypothetical protein